MKNFLEWDGITVKSCQLVCWHKRKEEKPTRCHRTLYCTYDTLNMRRVLLCPSSGAWDYMCVITAYGVQCLVAGCRGSVAGQQAVRPGRGILQHPSAWTHTLLSYTWPPTTSNQALHTTGGNNTHIISSSWWWAWKFPTHVKGIISAIKHSVISSWFFFSTHMQRCTDKHTSSMLT